MNLDTRVANNNRSVLALMEYLREIGRTPGAFCANESLISALKSQGGLSTINDESREIRASSINTHKRIAESLIPGGFDALNRLRLGALEAVNSERSKANRSNKRDKIGLTKRVNELDNDKQLLLQDLERLTQVFKKSLTQGRNYAQQSHKPSVIALCAREQKDLFDELSLMHATPQNVIAISRE